MLLHLRGDGLAATSLSPFVCAQGNVVAPTACRLRRVSAPVLSGASAHDCSMFAWAAGKVAGARVWTPVKPPPSPSKAAAEVQPRVIHQQPFFSVERDLPKGGICVVHNRVFRFRSLGIESLCEFSCSAGADGECNCRRQPPRPLKVERRRVLTPALPPPSATEAADWLVRKGTRRKKDGLAASETRLESHSKASEGAPCAGSEAVRASHAPACPDDSSTDRSNATSARSPISTNSAVYAHTPESEAILCFSKSISQSSAVSERAGVNSTGEEAVAPPARTAAQRTESAIPPDAISKPLEAAVVDAVPAPVAKSMEGRTGKSVAAVNFGVTQISERTPGSSDALHGTKEIESLHACQNLTVMCFEVHVRTKGGLMPNVGAPSTPRVRADPLGLPATVSERGANSAANSSAQGTACRGGSTGENETAQRPPGVSGDELLCIVYAIQHDMPGPDPGVWSHHPTVLMLTVPLLFPTLHR